MDTTQLVTDAKSDGKAFAADIKTAGEAVINSLGATAEAAVPQLVSDAEKELLTFVPAAFRNIVSDFAGKSVTEIDDAAKAAIKTGVGLALVRLDALV